MEDTLITQWYKWNVKVYDENTTYTDENRISDVNDLINGYFFSMKFFDKFPRKDLTLRDMEVHKEIFEIIRGFKKHFHHTAASQNYIPAVFPKPDKEYQVQIQFPTNTKVCASFCGEMEPDICVELTKLAQVLEIEPEEGSGADIDLRAPALN